MRSPSGSAPSPPAPPASPPAENPPVYPAQPAITTPPVPPPSAPIAPPMYSPPAYSPPAPSPVPGFLAAAPAPVSPPSPVPAPEPVRADQLQAPRKHRLVRWLPWVAALIVIAGVAVFLFFPRNTSSSVPPASTVASQLKLPAQIQGLAQYHTSATDSQIVQMRESVGGQPGIQSVEIAYYGSPTDPKFLMFIGMQGESSQLSQFLNVSTASLKAAGITINQSSPTVQTVAGAKVTCDPMTVSLSGVQSSGAICSSIKGNALEIVVTYKGFDTTASIAAIADALAHSNV